MDRHESRTYYEVLGVESTAPVTDIKKAYYKLSKQWHPDKNLDDKENATQMFQEIGEAYQVLSDEKLRERYDRFGKAGVREHEFVDPSTMFSMLFGGGKFEHLVGELKMAFMASRGQDMPSEDSSAPPRMTHDAEMDEWQSRRIELLAVALVQRLEQYVQGDERGFVTAALEERSDLIDEPMGSAMLEAIGYTYTQTAKSVSNKRFADGGIMGTMRNKHMQVQRGFHKLSTGFSAVSGGVRAITLHSRLKKRSDALTNSGVAEEDLAKDPEIEKIAKKLMEGMHDLLWRFSRFDVDATVRKVVKLVLSEKGAQDEALRRRCSALVVLGEIFQGNARWLEANAANKLPSHELGLQPPNLESFKAHRSASTECAGEVPVWEKVHVSPSEDSDVQQNMSPSDLRPGDLVRINGLKRAQQYNGEIARITHRGADDEGSKHVRVVLQGAECKELSLAPANLQLLVDYH
jgi:hypothetical protein